MNFTELLKMLQLYELKTVARNTSNFYLDTKEGISYRRKETVAEHVYSSLKLADFFLQEPEFAHLDRLKVYDLLLYHDDVEMETQDLCISNREARKNKERMELEALPRLAAKYPRGLDKKLLTIDKEYRAGLTAEVKFAHAVDKFDALVHELKYPLDWGPKGFTEPKVREWFQPAFTYSPTFMAYFERTIEHLRENLYF